MKRKILLSLLLLALNACIPVADLGDKWQKAGEDPDLAGNWRVVSGPPENIGLIRRFADNGGAYEGSVFDARGMPMDTGPSEGSIKTLQIGHYKLMILGSSQTNAAGTREGVADRYRIDGNTLETYDELGPSWVEFVERKYPGAINMKKSEGAGSYMTIIKFDDEVANILSNVPDTDDYWVSFEKLVKIR